MAMRIARQKTAPTKLLLMLGLTLTLSFSAICGWILWQAGGRDYLHSRDAAANLVSSLMLLHPGIIRRAALLRPMPVLDKVPTTDLAGIRTLIIAG